MTVQERRVTPISYEPQDAWDEAYDADGEARPLYAPLLAALAGHDLHALAAAVAQHATGEGATFGADRAFPVDPIPRLIEADEWRELEDGLGQRVRALDAFVSDLARERRIVQAGVVPERLAGTLPFLEPDLADLPEPVSARIVIAGLDVVRDIEGRFHVLEDNVRTPSGIAYLLATRRAT
jgi:uncharacterized circularly permuted ATP-grasp superfamily protein